MTNSKESPATKDGRVMKVLDSSYVKYFFSYTMFDFIHLMLSEWFLDFSHDAKIIITLFYILLCYRF